MTIQVNGEPRMLPHGVPITALLEELGLSKAACAVEVNRRLVPKADHAGHELKDGDNVEVVALVGGG